MRLLAFLGFSLGTIMALWGMGLITGIVLAITQGSENTNALIQIVGSLVLIVTGGATLAAGGEALKVVQQRSEVREREVTRAADGEVHTSETVDVESSGSLDSSGSGGGGL